MELFIGASVERPPGPKYQSALDFAELRFPSTLPRPQTFARWRGSVGEDFTVSLVAPLRAIGSGEAAFSLDDSQREGIEWLGRAAQAAEASAIVLPTAGRLSTGQRDRDRFARYLEALRTAAEEVALFWQPGGLWDLEIAAPFAEKLGVSLALNPLNEEELPEGSSFYFRLEAIGGRRRFTTSTAYELLPLIQSRMIQSLYISILSERSVQEAAALRPLLVPEG